MKALLLAAGLGTRLRPITNNIPKCLVPINNKPLIQYWFENLTKVGITEILVNTHYFSNKVTTFINNSKYKNQVTVVYEKELLNTGGTVLKNKEFLNNESFLLIHADNLCFCNFNEFIKAHNNRPKSCEITMMLFESDNPSSCGIVELNKENIVKKFHEKVKSPPSNLANGAVYICEPSIIDFLISLNKKEIDFSLDVIPNFLGKINTFINHTYHRDIGTPESLQQAQIDIKKLVK